MQLRIRQRIFSWTDSYDVYDEAGYAKYEVRGALFSRGHQIHNWSDTYVLNYYNPSDEAVALLLVLAIEAANCSHTK